MLAPHPQPHQCHAQNEADDGRDVEGEPGHSAILADWAEHAVCEAAANLWRTGLQLSSAYHSSAPSTSQGCADLEQSRYGAVIISMGANRHHRPGGRCRRGYQTKLSNSEGPGLQIRRGGVNGRRVERGQP